MNYNYTENTEPLHLHHFQLSTFNFQLKKVNADDVSPAL